MKKHKSVVAILLAVMMIFTMMPAMVFAANDSAVWDSAYANVAITKGTTSINYPAVRTFGTDGVITATADDSAKSQSQTFASSGLERETAYFYDLDGAKLAVGTSEFKTREFSRDDFISYFSTTNAEGERVAKDISWKLIAKRPAYDTTSDAALKESTAFIPTNYSVVFDAWKLFDANNTEAQEITVPVEIKLAPNAEIGKNGTYECLNAEKIPSITLKIAKEVTSPAKAQFYFDGKDDLKVTTNGTTINVPALTYDGSAFVLKMKDAEGLSVKYQVLQNGRYTDVNEISVTDVAANPVKARAIVTKGTVSVTYNADLTVAPRRDAFSFVFDEDGNVGSYQYGVEGEEYNAMDYLLVAPAVKADKKAVAANAEQFKAYFNDFYEITSAVKKANPNMVALSIEQKDLTTAEAKTLAKKYEALMANFAMDAATDYAGISYEDAQGKVHTEGTDAIVWLNDVAATAPEIEFVSTPTSKTYKAKVLKKKAKSFKVKAESTIGADVSYKLINAPEKIVINKTTGKITLKKGLKKGTYKIKVKAYLTKDVTPDKYGAVSETQSITIKVKK